MKRRRREAAPILTPPDPEPEGFGVRWASWVGRGAWLWKLGSSSLLGWFWLVSWWPGIASVLLAETKVVPPHVPATPVTLLLHILLLMKGVPAGLLPLPT